MALQLSRDAEFRVRDSELGVPDGDEETVYIMRTLTKDILREQSKARKSALRAAGSAEARAALGDESDWLLNFALVGWEGVLLVGEPAPCTAETKRMIDIVRTTKLLEKAGLNQIAAAEEQRSQSFR